MAKEVLTPQCPEMGQLLYMLQYISGDTIGKTYTSTYETTNIAVRLIAKRSIARNETRPYNFLVW